MWRTHRGRSVPRIYTQRSDRPWVTLNLCVMRRYNVGERDLVPTLLILLTTRLHRPQHRKKTLDIFSPIIIETGVWPKSSPHKAWCNTVIVLPVFSLLRHRGAKARRSEPKRVLPCPNSKLDWRLAIGFLAIDNSGPAAVESEFAASVMRQLRRPIGYVHGTCGGGRPRQNRAELLLYART